MHENNPTPLASPLQQAMDDALRPMFGDSLPAYYLATEQHQAEARELIDRARTVTQELIDAALDRLTFFGGERLAHLGEAHTITQAQRAEIDKELHEALVAERERHNRRVEGLQINTDEDSPAEDAPRGDREGEQEE